jgi:DNA-binding response OmpR family regulator
LAQLAQSPGSVRSKSDLSEHLYDADEDRDSNVLEVLVGRLRKKFASVMSEAVIETVRGSGYRFALENKAK